VYYDINGDQIPLAAKTPVCNPVPHVVRLPIPHIVLFLLLFFFHHQIASSSFLLGGLELLLLLLLLFFFFFFVLSLFLSCAHFGTHSFQASFSFFLSIWRVLAGPEVSKESGDLGHLGVVVVVAFLELICGRLPIPTKSIIIIIIISRT
jgi:hypothetical protein